MVGRCMVTYNALISACEKGQEPRRAFDVGAGMLRPALLPSMVSYNALISACVKGRETRRAFDVGAGMLRPASGDQHGQLCCPAPSVTML